jgi:hypothetical protein
MSSEERAFLENFIVSNPDLERLEALLAKFNIFEAIDAVRQELRHSDFLAFLLNPSENHGLGDIFLKKFLMRVPTDADNPSLSAIEIDVSNLQGAEIRREWRNIDILIHVHDSVSRLVCAIENKVYTTEHSDQLRRYREIVNREFAGYRLIFIYLTPEGDIPSDETYIPFSYTEIAKLVDNVHQTYKSILDSEVYTLMAHYTTMLRRHIVSDSEIAELCQKIYHKHQKALDLIFEHRPDLQADLAEVLRKLIESKVPGLVLDHFTKTLIYFSVVDWDNYPGQRTGQGWTKSGRVLLFEFGNFSNQLSLRLIIGPAGSGLVRQAIHQIAFSHPKIFRGMGKQLRSKWTMIYKRRFLAPSDYEDADLEILTKKVQVEWDKFYIEDLPTIRQALAEIQWPNAPALTEMNNATQ